MATPQPDAVQLTDDICTHLSSFGVGTYKAVGQDIFGLFMPENPTSCVAVIPQGGIKNPGDPLQKPAYQVLIRDTWDNVEIHTSKVTTISALLDNNWEVFSVQKGRLTSNHQVGPQYFDQDNNRVYTLNFTVDLAVK